MIDFAEKLQCNNVMSDLKFYKESLVCETETCPAVVAPPTPTDDPATDTATGMDTSLGPESGESTVQSTRPSLISEPIEESIKNTTKPLGFYFPSPNTAACDVCKTKYIGHEVLKRAALAELRKHEDMLELVKACERGNDTFGVRTEALHFLEVDVVLDMDHLHEPKYQAVLVMLVLQCNRHRAGHHRSCFKLKIKGTCRYNLPASMHLLTTLMINNMEFDTFGNVHYIENDVADTDDDVPSAAIVDDPSAAPLSFVSDIPQITVFKMEDITNMDIVVNRQIGSEYINRYNPIVMLTFGWNNDMTTMFTSPGIIHYVTNYISKGPDAGGTGAATIRAFKATVDKRQREAAVLSMETDRIAAASGQDATNPFLVNAPHAAHEPSIQQISQRKVIATMFGATRTQEFGQNLVAYCALYKTTHLHSHKYSTIQLPQMLAYLRGEPINGIVSRVSPLVLQTTEAFVREADDEDGRDDDDDQEEEPAENHDTVGHDPVSTTISVPVKLAAVPQVPTPY